MKTIPFTKMVGAGNDFLVLENLASRNPSLGKDASLKILATQMCSRQTGVGADGLLILEPSKKADYKMRIINVDGSEAEMCGNGARCLATYIVRHCQDTKKTFALETLAGLILAQAKGERARVRLTDPRDYQPGIALKVNGRMLHVNYIDTGVPHSVVFVEGLSKIDVETLGRTIRFHDHFKPRGTNVDFVEQLRADLVELRTYERGVEAETLACGTGAVAAGLVSFLKANPNISNKKDASMKVKTKSKEVLEITFDLTDHKISEVWLDGSARFVAEGEYYPPLPQNFRSSSLKLRRTDSSEALVKENRLGASVDFSPRKRSRHRGLHV